MRWDSTGLNSFCASLCTYRPVDTVSKSLELSARNEDILLISFMSRISQFVEGKLSWLWPPDQIIFPVIAKLELKQHLDFGFRYYPCPPDCLCQLYLSMLQILKSTHHIFKIIFQPKWLGSEIIKCCSSSRVMKAPLSFPLRLQRAEEQVTLHCSHELPDFTLCSHLQDGNCRMDAVGGSRIVHLQIISLHHCSGTAAWNIFLLLE